MFDAHLTRSAAQVGIDVCRGNPRRRLFGGCAGQVGAAVSLLCVPVHSPGLGRADPSGADTQPPCRMGHLALHAHHVGLSVWIVLSAGLRLVSGGANNRALPGEI